MTHVGQELTFCTIRRIRSLPCHFQFAGGRTQRRNITQREHTTHYLAAPVAYDSFPDLAISLAILVIDDDVGTYIIHLRKGEKGGTIYKGSLHFPPRHLLAAEPQHFVGLRVSIQY